MTKNLDEIINDAEFGSVLAQLKIAKHFLSNDYFDFDRAEKWLKRLIEVSSSYAKFELFNLYNNGREQDGLISDYSYQKASEVLAHAAEDKHIEALYQLGLRELSINETVKIGLEHIIDAHFGGHRYATKLLLKYDWDLPSSIELAANGDLYNKEANDFSCEARDLYYKIELSRQGDNSFINSIGDFFNNSELYEDAAIWYKKSADLGSDDAKYNLALLHQDFKLEDNDLNEALRLLEPLVKKLEFDAVHLTCRIYLIQKKYAKAVAYFRAAALIAPTKQLADEELRYAERFKENFEGADDEIESQEIFKYLKKIFNK
jgi:TPR repeat protein